MTSGEGIGGIVLCGGSSTRMGRPKEWLRLGEEFLLQRVVRVVGEAVEPVVVAARRGQELPPLPAEVTVVCDAVEDFGPLAGIAAGMDALRGRCEATFVTPCDHPFLCSEVIAKLIDRLGQHRGVVVRHDARVYPLLGVYRLETRAQLAGLIARGERKAERFAEECEARMAAGDELRAVDPNLRCLENANDWRDYEEALRRG